MYIYIRFYTRGHRLYSYAARSRTLSFFGDVAFGIACVEDTLMCPVHLASPVSPRAGGTGSRKHIGNEVEKRRSIVQLGWIRRYIRIQTHYIF